MASVGNIVDQEKSVCEQVIMRGLNRSRKIFKQNEGFWPKLELPFITLVIVTQLFVD